MALSTITESDETHDWRLLFYLVPQGFRKCLIHKRTTEVEAFSCCSPPSPQLSFRDMQLLTPRWYQKRCYFSGGPCLLSWTFLPAQPSTIKADALKRMKLQLGDVAFILWGVGTLPFRLSFSTFLATLPSCLGKETCKRNKFRSWYLFCQLIEYSFMSVL